MIIESLDEVDLKLGEGEAAFLVVGFLTCEHVIAIAVSRNVAVRWAPTLVLVVHLVGDFERPETGASERKMTD